MLHTLLTVGPHCTGVKQANTMACRLTKALICWLLMTSPSTRGDVARLMGEVTPESSTSHRPAYIPPASSRGLSKGNVTTQPSSPTEQSDNDNNDDGNASENATSPLHTSDFPAHLRGEGLVTSEDYESITYIISVVTAPVMLVGIVTNCVTVVVCYRMPRTATSTFFIVATVLDIGFLLSGLPPTVTYLVLREGEATRDAFYLTYGIYVSNYVTNTMRKVLVCVTMMLSLDRYLMVAMPLRMKKYDHLRRPKLYTLIVGVLAFLLDINVLFRFKVIESTFQNDTGNHCTLLTTDLFRSHRQMFFDLSLASNFLFKYIPLTVLVVSNILLVVSLTRHSRHMMEAKLDESTHGIDAVGSGLCKKSAENIQVQMIAYRPASDEQMKTTGKVDISGLNRSSNASSGLPRDSFPDCRDDAGIKQRYAERQDQGQRTAPPVKSDGCWKPRLASGRRRLVSQKPDRQHSMMVLMYSFIFAFLALPNTFYPVLRKTIPGFSPFGRHHFLVLTLNNVYFLLDTVSSAINFFVCFLTGSAFRAGVYALFNVHRFNEQRAPGI